MAVQPKIRPSLSPPPETVFHWEGMQVRLDTPLGKGAAKTAYLGLVTPHTENVRRFSVEGGLSALPETPNKVAVVYRKVPSVFDLDADGELIHLRQNIPGVVALLAPPSLIRDASGQTRVRLLTELCNTTLESYTCSSQREKIEMCLEVAKKTQLMHASGLFHGDLKPGNIGLLTPSRRSSVTSPSPATPAMVRILDLGSARLSTDPSTPNRGFTPAYCPPLSYRRDVKEPTPSTEEDIFSLAAIIYDVFTEDPTGLYKDACKAAGIDLLKRESFLTYLCTTTLEDIRNAVERSEVPYRSVRIRDLLLEILTKPPEERPSLEAIIAELQNIVDTGDYREAKTPLLKPEGDAFALAADLLPEAVRP